MNKLLRALGPWAVAAVLALGGFVAFSAIADWNPFRTEEVTTYGPSVVESIQSLSELTSVEYVQYTTVEKKKDRGLLNWANGDEINLFALARIGAGVDLSQIEDGDVDADFGSRTVRVTLPNPKITYVELDDEVTEVLDRDTGLFTKGDQDLERQARVAAVDELRSQALQAGILDEARANAIETLTIFLKGLGFEDVVVEPGFVPDPSSL